MCPPGHIYVPIILAIINTFVRGQITVGRRTVVFLIVVRPFLD
jgi:hypothetical protein